MDTLLLIIAFAGLAGLFWHGASCSLAAPRQTDHEIEAQVNNAVFDLLKALCLGGIALVCGLIWLAWGGAI